MFNSLPKILVLLAVPLTAQAPSTIGELFASEATAEGPALPAGSGMSVVSGSQLSAGKSAATLRLARGGEVKICPQSSVAVNSTSGSDGLMFSLGASALELNYPLNEVADTLITPDFKFMLAGPGVFHFAVGVNSRGDTCVRPLRGNSSSVIVSEMLGQGVYQIKPDEAVMFSGGKLNQRSRLTGDCGCPAPVPVKVAENKEVALQPVEQNKTPILPPEAPLPAEKPGDVHVQIDAPLVFRGDQVAQQPYTVARVNFSSLPDVFSLQEKMEPPVLQTDKGEVSASAQTPKPKEKKGFFGRMKGFFSSMFHKNKAQ